MLPIPFINYIPDQYDKTDPRCILLASLVDAFLTDVKNGVIGVGNMSRYDKANALFLQALNDWFYAKIKSSDSDYAKRAKIGTAISRNRQNGVFNGDVKIIIDAITGLSSSIYRQSEYADWIIMGGMPEEDAAGYDATLGVDGIDDMLGIDLVTDGTEPVIAGNIYIDLGGDAVTPPAATLDLVVNELIWNGLPAYFILYLGYFDAVAGKFVVYPGYIL